MQAIAHGEMYGHRQRVCVEFWLWEKNPLPHRGLEPASVLRSGTLYQLSYSRNIAAETDRWIACLKHTYCVVIDTPWTVCGVTRILCVLVIKNKQTKKTKNKTVFLAALLQFRHNLGALCQGFKKKKLSLLLFWCNLVTYVVVLITVRSG